MKTFVDNLIRVLSLSLVLGCVVFESADSQTSRIMINEFMALNSNTISDEAGDFDDWLEIYNGENNAVNLSGFYLTDDLNFPQKWPFPDISVPAKHFLLIWADAEINEGACHTNFKLNGDGEQIGLFHGAHVVDSLTFSRQESNISQGRYPDGANTWIKFSIPTPGHSNASPRSAKPLLTPRGGFYNGLITVKITAPQAKTYYTLDCTEPTMSSNQYTDPIAIDKTTVIRARAYESGHLPSEVVTETFILGQDFNIATLSLVTDPKNLWDPDSGIYVNPNERGDEWERPVAIEFFEADNEIGFIDNAGIRIHGKTAQLYDKKPFRLYFREEYGNSWLNYPLFHRKSHVSAFKRLVIHSGGTDMPANPYWLGWTLIRDPLMYELTRRVDGIYPANRPVALYLNGEAWGIYNLEERIDKYFFESNYGESDTDLIENGEAAKEGDMDAWNDMIQFLNNHDLSFDINYDSVKNLIDIANFTDYCIIEIFGGNKDWPHNNQLSFISRKDGAHWRFVIWDMDGCFGPYGVESNILEWGTRDDPSTIILRKLLENKNYCNFFINRFADLLNTLFLPDNVNPLIDSLAGVIRSDISFETEKWGSSALEWQNEGIDGELRAFANDRPAIVRQHILTYFAISSLVQLTIKSPQSGEGIILLNTIFINQYPWNGIYFKDVPIDLEAIPRPGFRFKKWVNPDLPQSEKIRLSLKDDYTIQAVFEAVPIPSTPVINEINYHSATDFNPEDWIELYNPADNKIDLSGWHFKDEEQDHDFQFPVGTVVDANQFLVLCRDRIAFRNHFPQVNNYVGNFVFGLGDDGDMIRIYDASLRLVDSVKYEDGLSWPIDPEGTGATLELINPTSDNSVAQNWRESAAHGTPGQQNSKFSSLIQMNDPNPAYLTCSLSYNYPNPFNGSTQFSVHLSAPTRVHISLYNLLGQQIKTLVDEQKAAGSYHFSWDGRDNQDQIMPAGIYFLQLKSEIFSQNLKVTLLR